MHPKPIACCSFFVINFIFFVFSLTSSIICSIFLTKTPSFTPVLWGVLLLSVLALLWSIFGLCGASYNPDSHPKRLVFLTISVAVSLACISAILILSGLIILFNFIREYTLPALWNSYKSFLNELPSSPFISSITTFIGDSYVFFYSVIIFSVLLLLHFLSGWRLLGMKRFMKV